MVSGVLDGWEWVSGGVWGGWVGGAGGGEREGGAEGVVVDVHHVGGVERGAHGGQGALRHSWWGRRGGVGGC